MSDSLLSGLTVLDATTGISGGYCTKLLADLGATVTKVESPISWDSTRRTGPFADGIPNPETSAPFLYLNSSKRSITLNLGNRLGRNIFRKLAANVDVVVENFDPTFAIETGLNYKTLKLKNPSMVMASISWFGQTGSYSDYNGSDIIAYSLSGYMYLTGDEDKEPLKAGGDQSSYQTGLAASMAILAALNFRDLTSEGQHVDVSSIEALAATFDGTGVFTMEDRVGIVPKRAGTRLVSREPHSPYPSNLLPCKDGWVHVHWSPSYPEGLAFLTGDPTLESDEVMGAMRGHAQKIDKALTNWLRDLTRAEVQALAQEVRVPFTMVQSIAETLEDPQNQASNFFEDVDHPIAGKLRYPRTPISVGNSRPYPKRAPLLGEHNEDVFCGELGYSLEDLSRLVQMKII